jgi:hypothetical protein
MRSWQVRFPGRLEHELADFAERGLDFSVDAERLDADGHVVIVGSLLHAGEEIPLEVVYPDLFPWMRPEVYAKGLNLARHQNPYEGNFCLLDRSSRAWKPSYTAAWLVAEKVPFLLDLLAADLETMRDAESPQGEPASTYFIGTAGTTVFIPAEMLILPADARAGAGRIAVAPFEGPNLGLRGAIAELVEKRGSKKTKTLATFDETLQKRFAGPRLPFRWVRLTELPTENSPAALLAAIEAAQPGFGTPRWETVSGGAVAIVAAVFKEEVRQGEEEDAWLFVVRARTDEGVSDPYIVRGERLSRSDLELRLPAHVRLGERCVALAGLGALGGELAIELAKAGLGRLRGLDFDTVEAGTIVRWPAGLTTVGRLKAGYLNERMLVDYPYTAFEPVLMQIGGSARSGPQDQSELEVLETFLSEADLLIDATAEIGVQQALATLAAERGVPALFVSATEGARGGLVARIDPAEGGCWMCLQLALDSGKIPAPARAEATSVQPRGCSDVTYAGASFDLLPIVAQAARVATTSLSSDIPLEGSFVFVCSLPGDELSPPEWSTHSLDRHSDCPICSKGRA